MKKSFMTRALATGLSVAMAFSLTAVTNVSTASAAVKPAMKASAMTVKEGKSRTYLATAKTLKTYKITKAVVKNASAKQYISVKKNAKGTGIVVTGKQGGTTGRKIVITFKNKTTKKTTTLTTKVVVKAVEKEEALAMTAAATGVKTIKVTFNKAVVSKPAITLTKGTATTSVEEVTWNDAATEATIKTSGKLTQGTYTVSTTVDSQPFTADVVVEKNETMTSFALVGTTLKADKTVTTKASIEYQALNQYGEPMNCSTVNVTVAPGEKDTDACKTPTASSNGVAAVKNIPTLYTIAGSKFSIVLVDTTTGVTLTAEAVYGAAAKAAKVESVGLYNTSKSKIMDMTAGDTIANYEALFKVTDQYDDAYTMTKEDVQSSGGTITAVAASGVTNAKVGTFSSNDAPIRTVSDVQYFAVPLTAVSGTTAVAGEFSLTLVNNTLGIIGTASYTVASGTTIASFDISADSIYAGQSNKLTYSATGSDGKAITDYDTLSKIEFKNAGEALRWSKNADGTATLTFTPDKATSSTLVAVTATSGDAVSGNYLVKTFTFNVLATRYAKEIVGVQSSFANSTAVSGKAIALSMSDLKIEDQYGNLFTADELKANTLVTSGSIFVTGMAVSKTASAAAWTVSSSSLKAKTVTMGSVSCLYAPATPSAMNGSLKIYIADKKSEAYTLNMYKIAESDLGKVTDLKIESVNAGYTVSACSLTVDLTDNSSKIQGKTNTLPALVSGKVNGHKIYVDGSIAEAKVTYPTLTDSAPTGTAKLTVTVATNDGNITLEKDFTYSKTAGTLTSVVLTGTAAADITTKAVTQAAITGTYTKAYKLLDQYGNDITEAAALSATYTLALTPSSDATYTLTKNGMSGAQIQVTKGSVAAKVTVKVGASSVTYSVTFRA